MELLLDHNTHLLHTSTYHYYAIIVLNIVLSSRRGFTTVFVRRESRRKHGELFFSAVRNAIETKHCFTGVDIIFHQTVWQNAACVSRWNRSINGTDDERLCVRY